MSSLKKKLKIIAIIPCRSGSKGIKDKNIYKLFGKPLIYYSIQFAKSCSFIDRVIVSTDSQKYARIAKKIGAEVPFLRPKKISGDNSLDIDFFKHAIDFLKKKQKYHPDIIIQLRPTSPIRKLKIMKKALNILLRNKDISSVRSVSKLPKNIYKCFFLGKKNILEPAIKKFRNKIEFFNLPRQKLPSSYYLNGVYEIFRTKLIKKNMISGKKIYGIVTTEYLDIDNKEDLEKVKKEKKFFRNFKKELLRI
jgi:CMP-N-acetylneuraminic acid synthetase|tara:strand:- start:67 stop:816 length:750 start_codon:yes stop_codon:yes gene_type:complete